MDQAKCNNITYVADLINHNYHNIKLNMSFAKKKCWLPLPPHLALNPPKCLPLDNFIKDYVDFLSNSQNYSFQQQQLPRQTFFITYLPLQA